VRVIRNLALRQFFTRCLPDQKNITSFPAVCTKNNRSENKCAEKAFIRLILANFQTGAAIAFPPKNFLITNGVRIIIRLSAKESEKVFNGPETFGSPTDQTWAKACEVSTIGHVENSNFKTFAVKIDFPLKVLPAVFFYVIGYN